MCVWGGGGGGGSRCQVRPIRNIDSTPHPKTPWFVPSMHEQAMQHPSRAPVLWRPFGGREKPLRGRLSCDVEKGQTEERARHTNLTNEQAGHRVGGCFVSHARQAGTGATC